MSFLLAFVVVFPMIAQQASETTKRYILGIGNSFTQDMMTQVPNILDKDTACFDLNYLCIWGGALNDQLNYIENDKPEYLYFHYDNGQQCWTEDTVSFSQVIDSRNWNIFVLQQSAQYSGIFGTIRGDLTHLLRLLDAKCPNAKHYWHLTWAFANGSDHPGFGNYDHSQLRMYYSIVNASSQIIHQYFRDDFIGYIPTGTLIQSLRSSYLCDSTDFCRDGYHLDLNIGRYAAACMFYEKVLAPQLSKSILMADGIPSEDSIHTAEDYAFIRQKAYEIAHNDSLVWGSLANRRIYRTDYYDLMGRPLPQSKTFTTPGIARYFYVSGQKKGERIITK